MNTKQKKVISSFFLLFFTFFTVTSVLAFDPRPQGGVFSEVDWGVYVQLIYGSLDGNSVFIPQQANRLPTPKLWVVMGGMERFGNRTITIDTYTKNGSSWILFRSQDYVIRMGDGGDPHYAMRLIEFPTINGTMRVNFVFKDILIDFFYEPLGIYVDVEITRAEVQGTIVIWMIITIIVGVGAELTGRKLQRFVIVIPGLPILSILAIGASVFTMIFVLTYMAYPFGYFEKVILFVLGIEPWLLEFPIFALMTLWLGHRHSPDNLKQVQLDYSDFVRRERVKGKEQIIWIKDINTDYRAYEKDSKWYICDPESWKEFFWRMFNFRIAIINHETSIKPTHGVWTKNDERLYIAHTHVEVEGKGLYPTPNFYPKAILQTGGIVFIGFLCVIISGLRVVNGLPQTFLLVLGCIIIAVGVFGRGMIFELKYQPHSWKFNPVEYLEMEQIWTQKVQVFDMRNKIAVLESDYRDAIANFHKQVALRVRLIAKKLNQMLSMLPSHFKQLEESITKKEMEELETFKEKQKDLEKSKK